MTTEEVQAPDQEAHRLTRKMCGNITSWKEWQECFESANKLPILMGLLHCAPDIGWSTKEELVAMYCDLLELADGYSANERKTFLNKGEKRHTGDWADVQARMRGEVAEKAFWALSQSLFKDDKRASPDNKPWMYAVLIPEIYEKLLWFFDDSERRGGLGASNAVIRSHRRDENHPAKVTADFLRSFLQYAWDVHIGDHHGEERKERQAMLLNSRSRLLKIFYNSENLDWFLGIGIHRKLDTASMKQLKELILWADGKYDTKQNAPVRVSRYTTMNEAVYNKAQDASTYVTLSILQREDGRRQAEARREQEKRNEERRKLERQVLKTQQKEIEQKLKKL